MNPGNPIMGICKKVFLQFYFSLVYKEGCKMGNIKTQIALECRWDRAMKNIAVKAKEEKSAVDQESRD